MLTFAVKKKRTPSIAPKHHAPSASTMTPSLHLQQAKVRHILRGPTLQAKLTITAPNDKYEQEADRVADEVMRMPEPGLQRQVEPEEEEEEETLQPKPLVSQITPLVQVQRQEEPEEEEEELQAKPLSEQITPLVQRQVEPEEEEEEEEEAIQTKLADGMQVQCQEEPEEEEEEEAIQTKQVSTRAPAVSPNLASRIQSLKGGGQPLPRSVHAFFEPRFDYDFSHVRVHTDTQAAETARSLNARAFTIGRHVVFRDGQYVPDKLEGRKLLAHELTHVVQQNKMNLKKNQGLFIQLQDRRRRRRRSIVPTTRVPIIKFFDTKSIKNYQAFRTGIMNLNPGTTHRWILYLTMHGTKENGISYLMLRNIRCTVGHRSVELRCITESQFRGIFRNRNFIRWRNRYGPTRVILIACYVSNIMKRAVQSSLLRQGSRINILGGRGPYVILKQDMPVNVLGVGYIRTRRQRMRLTPRKKQVFNTNLLHIVRKNSYFYGRTQLRSRNGNGITPEMLTFYFDRTLRGRWLILTRAPVLRHIPQVPIVVPP